MNTQLNHIQNWPQLAPEVKWSASALAKKCGVSVSTLERYFLKKTGKSPKVWMTEQRQREAAELLHGGSSVKEIAAYLGYKHPSHLTNEFKKHWGHCPTNNTTSPRFTPH
jgi:AraC-like DNA-binding protein